MQCMVCFIADSLASEYGKNDALLEKCIKITAQQKAKHVDAMPPLA